MALLDIQNLTVEFSTMHGPFKAVDGVSLRVEQGDVLAIVGESGSGKSVSMLALMGLLPWTARVTADQMTFAGQNLLGLSASDRRRLIGKDMAMIFQEPMTSLNPLHTIERQIGETLMLHRGLSGQGARERTLELLRLVRLRDPEERLQSYPHQLSGGQRQRVMIAIALACEPDLLIADEPTTALDVTIQIGILDLITKLTGDAGMALIMISHDLGVIARTTSRMAVMYAGRIVEEGPTHHLLQQMAHPYTKGLLAALPQYLPSSDQPAKKRQRLPTIKGFVPSPLQPINGCAFAERCGHVQDDCRSIEPQFKPLAPDHIAACHHPITTKSSRELIH